jgi:hypothetical protein
MEYAIVDCMLKRRYKMSEENILEDGGPAYPCTAPDAKIRKELWENREKFQLGVFDINRLCSYYPGMSLRDYFAGKALIAIRNRDAMGTSGSIAKSAYEDADAMIKERNKNG